MKIEPRPTDRWFRGRPDKPGLYVYRTCVDLSLMHIDEIDCRPDGPESLAIHCADFKWRDVEWWGPITLPPGEAPYE